MTDQENPYADIIDLPHHQAPGRPRMSLYNRAAQFSPYAALVGFDGVIAETARLTDRKKELSEWERDGIDRKLAWIGEQLLRGDPPLVEAEYFVPDPRKEGGACHVIKGRVKRVNAEEQLLQFYAPNGISAGKSIRISQLQDLRTETDPSAENRDPAGSFGDTIP